MTMNTMDESNSVLRLRGEDARDPRILVVEDDVELMNILNRIAVSLDSSIQVDWATDVTSALERIGRRQYDLVLADYYLAGSKCGLSLLDPCREIQPDADFAMMSSMSLEDLWDLPAARNVPLLRKPFTTQECLGFIGASLPWEAMRPH